MGLYTELKSLVLQPPAQLGVIQIAAKGKLDWIVSGRHRLRIFDTDELDDFFKGMSERVVSCGVIYFPLGDVTELETDPRYLELRDNYSVLKLTMEDTVVVIAS